MRAYSSRVRSEARQMRSRPCLLYVAAALATMTACPPPPPSEKPPVTHVAIVTDRSDSIERGDGAACNAIEKIVVSLVERSGVFGSGNALANLPLRSGESQLFLFGTADAASPGVPKQLESVILPGREKRGLEELPEDPNKRKQIADTLATACRRNSEPAQKVSPIYGAVKAAVERLKVLCEHPATECLLIVQSDLMETGEASIRDVVKKLTSAKGDTVPGDVDKTYAINLDQRISVYVCGTAEGKDVQQEKPRAQVLKLWQEHLLKNAKRWSAEASCPGYEPERRPPKS